MALTRTLTWDRTKTVATVQFVALLSIATIAPLFHQQWITGPIVNAMFLISVTNVDSIFSLVFANRTS